MAGEAEGYRFLTFAAKQACTWPILLHDLHYLPAGSYPDEQLALTSDGNTFGL